MRVCAPGSGASATWRGSNMQYFKAADEARRAAAARAAAAARMAQVVRDMRTGAARLAAADRLYGEGNIRVASMIYARVALARPRTPVTDEARKRMDKLAEEARRQLQAIDTKLPPGSSSPGRSPGEVDGPAALSEEEVLAAFQEYDELAERYERVPSAKREIKSRIVEQRRRPELAAVLKEPEARALWQLGQQHERDDQACCAFWVYGKAARLLPAPSAKVAQQRLTEMKRDSRCVAAAEACRELQHCHALYDAAQKVASYRPDRAKALYAQVMQRAPKDSEVYRGASQQLRELN